MTSVSFNPVECIAKKRDGGEHSPAELQALVRGYTAGRVTDYQMSAWLMAVFLRGLTHGETVALTMAMLNSGKRLDFRSAQRAKVDKHSTGGVGDKVSICLAPWVASCGLAVPMISGRGLGHTGGTLDKLEAIAGFDTQLGTAEFKRIVRRVGTAMIGQTPELAPADRKMYALRDVTATVNCIPLIVASILSKKLAEGLDGLVLDVKFGRGAFMQSRREAERLARTLVRVARDAGTPTVALLTDMNVPLGQTIGNALETREAFAVVSGRGPKDTYELTRELGIEMLRLGGVVATRKAAGALLDRRLADGSAKRTLQRMIAAQGGDARVVVEPFRLPTTASRVALQAAKSGYVRDIDALALAQVANAVGAGRTRADESVDHAVGIELGCTRGARIARGATLAWLHVRRRRLAPELLAQAVGAFEIGPAAPRPRKLVVKRIAG